LPTTKELLGLCLFLELGLTTIKTGSWRMCFHKLRKYFYFERKCFHDAMVSHPRCRPDSPGSSSGVTLVFFTFRPWRHHYFGAEKHSRLLEMGCTSFHKRDHLTKKSKSVVVRQQTEGPVNVHASSNVKRTRRSLAQAVGHLKSGVLCKTTSHSTSGEKKNAQIFNGFRRAKATRTSSHECC